MTFRMVARVLVMAVLLSLYLPAFGVCAAVRRRWRCGPLLSRPGWAGCSACGFAVEGKPVTGNVLFAANHISWLDIPAIGGTVRARFIAKSEIAGWSLIGWLAKIGGSVFVQRQKRSEARAPGERGHRRA